MNPFQPDPIAPGSLLIKQPIYGKMVTHVRNAYPLEACGMLAGNDEIATEIYQVDNILKSPYAYEMEPKQQLQAMLQIERQGQQLLAIYHSHPHGPPEPSTTDVAKAFYPETLQLIVSLRNPAAPVVRAFTIADGRIAEVLLSIEQL
jgi:proteasome lid subunit RPN8/RPN11